MFKGHGFKGQGHVRFTTVPFKSLSEKQWGRYRVYIRTRDKFWHCPSLQVTLIDKKEKIFEKKNLKKSFYNCLAYKPPNHPWMSTKKLAGYTQHIYECLVLLYKD